MTQEQIKQIEKAAVSFANSELPNSYNGERWADTREGFTAGAASVIKQPYLFGLGPRKPIGIQYARELVNQMMREEISFSRFVELINEGGK